LDGGDRMTRVYPWEEPDAGNPHVRICEGESRMAELLDRDHASLFGDHFIAFKNAGDLALAGDQTAIDLEKLNDLILYFEYTLPRRSRA
jgi:hypothetical protein